MINVRKGTAHSLAQSDLRGSNPGGIVAGMICNVLAGAVTAGGIGSSGVRGFAINNSIDGDVIESGNIALYSLDGNSVIETDQVDFTADSTTTINATDYPDGTPLYASHTAAGKVCKTSTSNGTIIGWVSGVRSLQNATPYPSGVVQGSQNYPSLLEAYNGTPVTKSSTFKAQVNIPVLGIKLAATA